MCWPLLGPKSEIVECLGFREHSHVTWPVFDRRQLSTGSELALTVTQAFVDKLYAGSVYLRFHISLLRS